MTSAPLSPSPAEPPLPPRVAHAFAPVHKHALGIATGVAVGLLLFGVTAFHLISAVAGRDLALLGQFFYGYRITWPGAFVGLFWGFVTGYVAGWFSAFVRNFFLAVWLLLIKARAQFTQPFLDHL